MWLLPHVQARLDRPNVFSLRKSNVLFEMTIASLTCYVDLTQDGENNISTSVVRDKASEQVLLLHSIVSTRLDGCL